jgi:hypothetical protein
LISFFFFRPIFPAGLVGLTVAHCSSLLFLATPPGQPSPLSVCCESGEKEQNRKNTPIPELKGVGLPSDTLILSRKEGRKEKEMKKEKKH